MMGFDPNSPEANIIFSLFQNAYLDQSLDLAAKVQKHFRNNIKNNDDRGIKTSRFSCIIQNYYAGYFDRNGLC